MMSGSQNKQTLPQLPQQKLKIFVSFSYSVAKNVTSDVTRVLDHVSATCSDVEIIIAPRRSWSSYYANELKQSDILIVVPPAGNAYDAFIIHSGQASLVQKFSGDVYVIEEAWTDNAMDVWKVIDHDLHIDDGVDSELTIDLDEVDFETLVKNRIAQKNRVTSTKTTTPIKVAIRSEDVRSEPIYSAAIRSTVKPMLAASLLI